MDGIQINVQHGCLVNTTLILKDDAIDTFQKFKKYAIIL